MSRSKIIRDNEIDISGKTAKRYDDILINEKAMEENKMVYYYINKNDDSMTEITEQEYQNFWKDNKVAKMALANVKRKREKFEITEDFSDYSIYDIITGIGNDEGCIAIKFMTYKQAENAKEILDMINKFKKMKSK